LFLDVEVTPETSQEMALLMKVKRGGSFGTLTRGNLTMVLRQ